MNFKPPILSEINHQDLSLESTLKDLPLYDWEISVTCSSETLAEVFAKYPLLPGAILVKDGNFLGMISRQRFLEYLILPHGLEIFWKHPLESLYQYARTSLLILAENTPILTAAQFVFRRTPELQNEPIILQSCAENHYYLLDIHTLHVAAWQLRGIETQVRYERSQVQMIQSEKMASLGRLVSGISHEILDPVGFVWGNLTYVKNYTQNLIDLVSIYDQYSLDHILEINQIKSEIEYEFIQTDLPRIIASIEGGAERLSKLARSLQNFCHLDTVHPKPADLNSLIEGILLLLKSRLNSEISLIKNYGNLPPISCYAGELNQVFMNILSNAIDSLINRAVSQKINQNFAGYECLSLPHPPWIKITTKICSPDPPPDPLRPDLEWVLIEIADNGPGISPEMETKIRESFSTKKRGEKETSLAMSYQIITAKHGGELRMSSRHISYPGHGGETGTIFQIFLPLS